VNKAPNRTKYFLSDVYNDLLEFSVNHLVEGGRLTFWLPMCFEEQERQDFMLVFFF
jgi:hypothetical protein